jgi:hypothetical protein
VALNGQEYVRVESVLAYAVVGGEVKGKAAAKKK